MRNRTIIASLIVAAALGAGAPVEAGGTAKTSTVTVRNSFYDGVVFHAYDKTDGARIVPTQSAEIAMGASATLACNTSGGCDVKADACQVLPPGSSGDATSSAGPCNNTANDVASCVEFYNKSNDSSVLVIALRAC